MEPALRPGTITAVRRQKRDPERVSVYLDGAFAFGLMVDLALQHGLRKGLELDVPTQEAMLREEEMLRARRAALDLLAYRAQTAHEIRTKLARKGFSEEAAEAAAARMDELGYIDDADFARAFVRGRLAGRGYGPERLRMDLRRRGVAAKLIEEALEDEVEEDALYETALRHGRRRWLRLASEPDAFKRRKKLGDFLLRRGYGYDLVRRVTETLEAEESG